jgi:hypothetical protein
MKKIVAMILAALMLLAVVGCGGGTSVEKKYVVLEDKLAAEEYGIGFRMYEDHYPLSREAMSCEDTPFTTDRYPFE